MGDNVDLMNKSPINTFWKKQNIKLTIAGFLAISTWSVLGYLICAQFNHSVDFAKELVALEQPGDKDRINVIKEANETVSKTSSSLYAFITPFATAITGYFFISSGMALSKKNKDLPIDPTKLPEEKE